MPERQRWVAALPKDASSSARAPASTCLHGSNRANGRQLAGWEKRKLKYEKYAEKGKPEKLEKAMEKQRAKLQKATDKGKPQEYLMYKAEKIEFTQKMWTLAHLVANMKRAGFLPQC